MRFLIGTGTPPKSESKPATRSTRKKSVVGIRSWMLVDSTGHAEIIEAGNHSIMKRTGLPGQDIRIVDPLLSYPSTVLGRERAVVISLEHIKAIVTANEVLLLNFKDPNVDPFVSELQRRIQIHHGLKEARMDRDVEGDNRNLKKVKDLPFEFTALEVCLEAACSSLEIEATTLEKEAHLTLDKLTAKICPLNLEHVRQIKNRLVSIIGRVQKIRDELEHLLEDDDVMAEMYLTDKLIMQLHVSIGSYSHSLNEDGDDIDYKGHLAEISSEEIRMNNNCKDKSENIENHKHTFLRLNVNEDRHGTQTCSTRSGSKHFNIDELEMLLKAYFVQISNTLKNLSALREYVDDTEDCINIMLDAKLSHLLQTEVVLKTATIIITTFVLATNIFGMNIKTDFVNKYRPVTVDFWWIVSGGAIGSLFLYVLTIAWCKQKGCLNKAVSHA